MDNLQNQVNIRVEAFVAEITELARAAAYQALNSALDHSHATAGRGPGLALGGRKGGKRTAEELAQMADAFLAHVTASPGQRMEQIARELGLATPELTLPVKKLLADGKITVDGQKRATQYYPAGRGGGEAAGGGGKSRGTKARGAKGKRKKK